MGQANRYIDWVVSHRWWVILGSILVVALASTGFKRLTLESDYEVFFDSTNARLAAYREQEDVYGRQDNFRIAVTNTQGDVFQRDFLAIIEALTEDAWKTPHSRRVDSLTNFPYVRGMEHEVHIEDLFESSPKLSDKALEQRADFALHDPAVVNNLLSPDSRTAGLFITVNPPPGDKSAMVVIADYAKEIQRKYAEKYPQIRVDLTGSVMISDAFFQASTRGTGQLIAIMLLVSIVLVGILLRSVVGTVLTLVLIVMSVICAFGIGSWIGYPITAVSSSIPIIVMAISIATWIHLVNVFFREWRSGKSNTEALTISLQSNVKPISLTTLTTVIGFLCLNVGDVPPYRYMGTTTAIGVTFAFLFSFTLLPACLSFLSKNVKPKNIHMIGINRWDRLSVWLVKRNSLLTATLLGLSVVSVFFISENTINDSMVTYFDKDTKMRREAEYVMDQLSFIYSVHLSIPSGEEGGIGRPRYQKNIEKLIHWALEQPEVRTVVSYTDTIKNINRAINGGREEAYILPTSQELASQSLLLYEMSLPFGMDLNNRISIDKSSARITVGFYNISNAEMRAFNDRIVSWIENNWPQDMQTLPTSPPLLFAYIWYDSVIANLGSMLLAIGLISIVIGLSLNSVSLGVLSTIPNILPAIVGFGIWGAINGMLDIASSMVVVVIFGIVVDDTIHLMYKYLEGRNKCKLHPQAAAKHALTSVGPALLKTTIVLVIGFSLLATSTFHLNSSLGLLSALMIAVALAMDFTVLLFLLMKLDRFFVKAPDLSDTNTLAIEKGEMAAQID